MERPSFAQDETYVAGLAIASTQSAPEVDARRGVCKDTGTGGLVLVGISGARVRPDLSPIFVRVDIGMSEDQLSQKTSVRNSQQHPRRGESSR